MPGILIFGADGLIGGGSGKGVTFCAAAPEAPALVAGAFFFVVGLGAADFLTDFAFAGFDGAGLASCVPDAGAAFFGAGARGLRGGLMLACGASGVGSRVSCALMSFPH